jgi:outer membrane protein assembly factor BamB
MSKGFIRFATAALLFAPLVASAQQLAPLPPGMGQPEPPPPPIALVQAPAVPDWLSYGYDQQRIGWNRGETTLGKKNVGKLKLLWSSLLTDKARPLVLSTLTAPIVVGGVSTPSGVKDLVLTVSIEDTLNAVDGNTGQVVWKKTYPNPLTPLRPATVNCSNTEQATPVADKQNGVVYFTTSDGKLRSVALADGADRMAPRQMVQPFSRNWSLNLVDNVVYTAAGRGCGGAKEQVIENGQVTAIDVSDPAHPELSRFYTGKNRPAGPWGGGGAVYGPQGMYVTTADGPNNPAGGVFGDMVLAIRPHAYGINDSFTPPNWRYMYSRDLDLGSGGPLIFTFGNRTLVATAAKESVVYLLDANNLGGFDHMSPLFMSPRLGNDTQDFQAQGVWGGMATYLNDAGDRYIYVPEWGAPRKDGPKYPFTNGDAPHGSVIAYKVVADGTKVSMTPAWISRDLNIPSPPAVANGVVYVLQTAESAYQTPKGPAGERLGEDQTSVLRTTPQSAMGLFALDAETGKELWSSKKIMDGNMVHFTEPVVALGKLFAVDHAGHLWAFGLKK